LHPWNSSPKDVVVPRGKCIAQLELVQRKRMTWVLKNFSTLRATVRGSGRMDSTKTGI
jgi:dUTPase